MEEELSVKMKDFMTAIDQVKRYRALVRALPDMVIIIGLGIIGALTANALGLLRMVFGSGPSTTIANTLSVLFIVAGIAGGFFWVYRKMKHAKTGDWKSSLGEGAPGSVKLLQNTNWQEIYSDIRYAKLGFWLYGGLRTAALWIVTFVVCVFAADHLRTMLHLNITMPIVALFSLGLVLVLSTNDFRKRFDQIGKLDALLWELRWFDNELRRNPFQT